MSRGIWFAADGEGQYGIIVYSGGRIGTPSAALAGTVTWTNAETINDLVDWGLSKGASPIEVHSEVTETIVIHTNSEIVKNS